MQPVRPWRLSDWLLLLVVLVVAGGTRAWYLSGFANGGEAAGPWRVQDRSAEVPGRPGTTVQDVLVMNLKTQGILAGFKGYAPLGTQEEVTAHVAPGYPILRSLVEQAVPAHEMLSPEAVVRWVQAGLGSLTAVFYFLLARRAFRSTLVATLAGLFCALHPFWILNTAELEDGTLATFLLAAALALGARAGQQGGALSSFLYGLLLALLALVRAALLPFAVVAVLWFFLQSRRLPYGGLYALLAFLAFITGLNSWFVRNYREFNQVVPIVDTAWWHLWVGNNPQATGGPPGQEAVLSPEQRVELARHAGAEQPKRYEKLAGLVVDEMSRSPAETFERRLFAAIYFFVSAAATHRSPIVGIVPGAEAPPLWLAVALAGTLLGMLLLAVLGWRWSYAWRHTSMPLQLAVYWVPVPYILSHADWLHGPRLPLDGPLLCLAALALVGLLPGVGYRFRQGPQVPAPSE